MDMDSINTETLNIHYTAHQFWEQEGPLKMLMRVVEKMSFLNPEVYNKPLKNFLGKDIYKNQVKIDKVKKISFWNYFC